MNDTTSFIGDKNGWIVVEELALNEGAIGKDTNKQSGAEG